MGLEARLSVWVCVEVFWHFPYVIINFFSYEHVLILIVFTTHEYKELQYKYKNVKSIQYKQWAYVLLVLLFCFCFQQFGHTLF